MQILGMWGMQQWLPSTPFREIPHWYLGLGLHSKTLIVPPSTPFREIRNPPLTLLIHCCFGVPLLLPLGRFTLHMAILNLITQPNEPSTPFREIRKEETISQGLGKVCFGPSTPFREIQHAHSITFFTLMSCDPSTPFREIPFLFNDSRVCSSSINLLLPLGRFRKSGISQCVHYQGLHLLLPLGRFLPKALPITSLPKPKQPFYSLQGDSESLIYKFPYKLFHTRSRAFVRGFIRLIVLRFVKSLTVWRLRYS